VSSLGREWPARSLAIIDLEPPLHRQLGVVRRKDKRIGAALGAVLAILEDLRREIDKQHDPRARRPRNPPSRVTRAR
jgi:hypothetical protein